MVLGDSPNHCCVADGATPRLVFPMITTETEWERAIGYVTGREACMIRKVTGSAVCNSSFRGSHYPRFSSPHTQVPDM